jgi:hypothetical protein
MNYTFSATPSVCLDLSFPPAEFASVVPSTLHSG